MEHNQFDGPIAGESLTGTPGALPYEQPPQYTQVDDAMGMLLNHFSDPEAAARVAISLEQGVSSKALADIILTSGFTEGKWTPDLMLLIAEPLFELFNAIGRLAGVKVKTGFEKKGSPFAKIAKAMAAGKVNKELKQTAEELSNKDLEGELSEAVDVEGPVPESIMAPTPTETEGMI